MLNLYNFKPSRKQIALFIFASFIYFVNILPINQAGEISRYLSLFISIFLISKAFITFEEILNSEINNQPLKIELGKKIENETKVEKVETKAEMKIPEFSWAHTIETFETGNKNTAGSMSNDNFFTDKPSMLSKNLQNTIYAILLFTILFLIISPAIYKIIKFETFKTFIASLIFLPISIFTFWSIKYLYSKTNAISKNKLHINTFIVFLTTNILALIFKHPFIGIFISIFTSLIYLNYYLLFIENNSHIIKNIKLKNYTNLNLLKSKAVEAKNIVTQHWREILSKNINIFLILFFANIDLFVASLNFDNILNGSYFAFSFFIKMIFISMVFVYWHKINVLINAESISKVHNNLNLFFIFGSILTIISFFFSYILIGLFFKDIYFIYHTSLAFVVFANCILLATAYLFYTAIKIENSNMMNIFYIWLAVLLFLVFVFSINSIETLSFFIIGLFLVLSIFIYHFTIKIKDGYFANFL